MLHDASLYLPSLPPQYQPDRLTLVFQGDTVGHGVIKGTSLWSGHLTHTKTKTYIFLLPMYFRHRNLASHSLI